MPQISSFVHSFDLDDEAVLFEEKSSQLYVLNATAAFIWSLVRQRWSATRIVAELTDRTGARSEVIEGQVHALLKEWNRAEILVDTAKAERSAAPETDRSPESMLDIRSRDSADYAGPIARSAVSRAYRLLDYRFELRSDAKLAELADTLLGHLTIPAPGSDDAYALVELSTCDDGWSLHMDGELIAKCSRQDEIVPMLHANTLIAAYQNSEVFAVLHAAAVYRGSHCVILPAISGSGKSTLTAALLSNGLSYCTDDLAVLTDEPIRLRPAPIRLGIKEGSWELLRDLGLKIETLPIYRRAYDQRLVRYLLPDDPNHVPDPETTFNVRALVFPEYQAGSKTVCRLISTAEALRRVTEAGYDTHQRLDKDWLEKLICWLNDTPCYELRFDALRPAVDAVSRFLR